MRITALMLIAIIVAGTASRRILGLLGITPTGARPTRRRVFGHVRVD